MLFLILSILCSVTVGVIFKVGRKKNLIISQVVAWNYVMAIVLCFLFFQPELTAIDHTAPWEIYIPLGILLPVIFLVLAASIKHMGIVKTDAAQRLSLFIPIVAAWLLFDEEFNSYKLVAFLIALPALLLILSKKTDNKNSNWIYPAIVLVGFGAIDILFKQIALATSLPFTTSLLITFVISLLVILTFVIYEIIVKKTKIQLQNLLFGLLVGLFNFGNILFYLKAHQAFAKNPSTVFAAMNMGVIVMGSIVGVLVFKEKLNTKNYIGLVFALLAIVLITYSQMMLT
ncbi:drug/metabolite transporter (DMT)-like permease [Flavobacterium sp. 28A]|uniref:EamA family transporter n=1 Tax=Flavobacterium sp. 28A TaxID=2735895 RepID=UPI00156E3B11|nr:EamA family transporter [Flavobacterium sp. 28A]NRT15504.1 drug/metabolite transporter (DMT)-like permease [Flavobacterium sp. 28A]